MSEYIRYRVPGGSYFFTVNLLNRRTRLLTDYIEALRDSFRKVREVHPYHVDAVVVLPEHLHVVWTLPVGDDDYSVRWQQIKSLFSRSLPVGEGRSRSRQSKKERGVWQRRFWEHAIRDDEDYARHIDYIHYNPVKHGHVKRVKDWPYSSFHDYVKRGILPEDWGGVGIGFDADWG